MTNKLFIQILLYTTFTFVGILGCYYFMHQISTSESREQEIIAADDHSGHDHGDHEGHDHGSEESNESSVLSSQALMNLNVKIKEVEVETFFSYRNINGRIESTPQTLQPIITPIGGYIKSINIVHGEKVNNERVVFEILRDSIERPDLNIVGDLLSSDQRMKGLSSKDIAELNKKNEIERQSIMWKNTLKKHGYWNDDSQRVLNALPSEINNMPYTIAVLGEITANGLFNNDFISLLVEGKFQKHFFEISSFLLDGKSIPYIKNLINLGALEPIVEINPPMTSKDFDVHEIYVKIGDKVEAGSSLAILQDMRKSHIVVNARGSEIGILMDALENDTSISAIPLTSGSGTKLENLKIRSILDDEENNGAKVHIEISSNYSIEKIINLKTFRSWKNRIGTRYLLQVPKNKFEEVYVLPSKALVEDGAEKIVFVAEGDNFKAYKVVVVYQNDEVVVLGSDSEIFPGDPVVINGAFDLGLALKSQSGGAVDPHAGHNH